MKCLIGFFITAFAMQSFFRLLQMSKTPGLMDIFTGQGLMCVFWIVLAWIIWFPSALDKEKEKKMELDLKPGEILSVLSTLKKRDTEIKQMDAYAAKLENEVNWLANKLANVSANMVDSERKKLGFHCSHMCRQTGCAFDCLQKKWIESARKAVEGQNV